MAPGAPNAATAGVPGASIRRTLLGAFLLALVAVLGVAAAVDYRGTARHVQQVYDAALGDLALAMATQIGTLDHESQFALSPRALDAMMVDSFDRLTYRVLIEPDRTLAGDPALVLPPDRPTAVPYDAQLHGEPVRVYALPLESGLGRIVVLVAETTRKREALLLELWWGRLLGMAAVVALAAVFGWVAIGHALRPLERLSEQLGRRSVDDLSPLAAAEPVPREIVPLVGAVDGLLLRLVQVREGQRRFLENAAHQLRTPLTGLKGQIDLAVRELRALVRSAPAESAPALQGLAARLDRVQSASDRVTHLAQQLLSLARTTPSSHMTAPREPVDLGAVAGDVVAAQLDAALARDIDLGVEAMPAWLPAVRWELRELTVNLVDNAIRYAPTGGRVTVRCGTQDARVFVEVEDDGPGIPPAERSRVFERFYRGRDSAPGGAGLGLAIVRDIVALYGATIEVLDGEGGRGTRMRVEFPRVPIRFDGSPAPDAVRSRASEPAGGV